MPPQQVGRAQEGRHKKSKTQQKKHLEMIISDHELIDASKMILLILMIFILLSCIH